MFFFEGLMARGVATSMGIPLVSLDGMETAGREKSPKIEWQTRLVGHIIDECIG